MDGLSSGRMGSMVGVLANSLSNGEIPSSLGEELSPHCMAGSRDGQSLVCISVILTRSWLLILLCDRSHTALPFGWYGDV